MTAPGPIPGAMNFIRHTHPDGFRSGEWAILRSIVPGPDRDCYLVEFADGVTDFWAVNDPAEPYEFTTGPERFGPLGDPP